MNNLVFSSAVMTLSQTTEFMRNKSIDNIIINLIVLRGLNIFTVKDAFDGIYSELPIRLEQIEKSLLRSYKNRIVEIYEGSEDEFRKAKFKLSQAINNALEKQYHQLNEYTEQAIDELFKEIITVENREQLKNLFLETVSNLMATYGYAYAGQLAGIANATEFVPLKELHQVCENAITKYGVKLTLKELAESIGYLFDRRDPCLNNLAFCICNRYYQTRLIGLDLPIDFLTENIYKDSTIYLDTNFIMSIAFTKSKRHNEFREILRNAEKLGVNFVASELTIAEIHARVQDLMPDIEAGEEILPIEIIEEIKEDILQQSHGKSERIEFNIKESENAKRLLEMGVDIGKFIENGDLFNTDELKNTTEELHLFDRKFRSLYDAKDDRALFHDAYHFFLIKRERAEKGKSAAWFLTMDHSVIEHAINKKEPDAPPYAIRLFTILQTLSQFVESHALKGEFSELFGELIAKDLLPRDQVFSYEDLKLLIGFDIKAKSIPPEFVRKATYHIKKNILRGGGITDENRAEVIHEYTKYLSTPDHNFLEIQQKFEKKLRDRDEDIKTYQDVINDKKSENNTLNLKLAALQDFFSEQMYINACEKYDSQKNNFIDNKISEYFESLSKFRNKYICFVLWTIFIFTTIFFIEEWGLVFGINVKINKALKYTLTLIIFSIPFIRAFFDHRILIQSFRVYNKQYKSEIESNIIIEFVKKYETANKKPELSDFKTQI